MIVRLLNTNHSPEDALALVRQFVNMAIQKKLKLDPELIEEIIATIINDYPEFINHLSIEDTTRILDMSNDIDAQLAQIPPPADGNRVGAFLRYFENQKDFVPIPSAFIDPKPASELTLDIKMTVVDELIVDLVPVLNPSKIETAHTKSSLFKVRDLQYVFSKSPYVLPESCLPKSTTSVPGSPVKGTRQSKWKGQLERFVDTSTESTLMPFFDKNRKASIASETESDPSIQQVFKQLIYVTKGKVPVTTPPPPPKAKKPKIARKRGVTLN
nr:protein zds1-like [Ipomoea batatas]